MAAGVDSASEGPAPARRGCLSKLGVLVIGLIVVGAISQLAHVPPSNQPEQTSPKTDIPPFTFEPSTSQQREVALAHMVKETDKVEDRTFYYDRASPRSESKTGFYPYIAKNQNSVELRLVARFAADNWIFFRNVVIRADDVRFELPAPAPEREVQNGRIWEELDVPVGPKEISILDFVRGAKDVTIRFSGPVYYFDKKLTARDKQAIGEVFLAYQALGGKPPE